MEKIIHIKGTWNVRKTTVLNTVINLLQQVAVEYTIEKPEEFSEDRNAIFVLNGKRIGICTAGDEKKIVLNYFKFFEENECDIAICSTHVKDETINTFFKKVNKLIAIEKVETLRKENDNNLSEAEQTKSVKEFASQIFNKIVSFCFAEEEGEN